jgi:hypothetical protein
MHSVPDFFQDDSEEAARLQVEWQQAQFGLDDEFFARFLGEGRAGLSAWRKRERSLAADKRAALHDWWQTVLHLLSFQGFDEGRVRLLLEQRAARASQTTRGVFSPPWSASSLREYLESHGREAVAAVDRWVESFRFGDPYVTAERGS